MSDDAREEVCQILRENYRLPAGAVRLAPQKNAIVVSVSRDVADRSKFPTMVHGYEVRLELDGQGESTGIEEPPTSSHGHASHGHAKRK